MTGVTAADHLSASQLGASIQEAERRQHQRWRLAVVIVWMVILTGLVAFIFGTIKLNAVFLTKSIPYILAGVPITLFVSFVSITIAIFLAVLGALGRLSRNPGRERLRDFFVLFFRGPPFAPPDPFPVSRAPTGRHRDPR